MTYTMTQKGHVFSNCPSTLKVNLVSVDVGISGCTLACVAGLLVKPSPSASAASAGDVLPEDYASKSVPLTETPPSEEFLAYLREFTPWRIRPVEKVHTSF